MPATLKEFESVFPQLVKDVEAHCEKYKLPDQALKWFNKVNHHFPTHNLRRSPSRQLLVD
jgi:farnesyl diphosphate synthase